jgi:hypothetical protein
MLPLHHGSKTIADFTTPIADGQLQLAMGIWQWTFLAPADYSLVKDSHIPVRGAHLARPALPRPFSDHRRHGPVIGDTAAGSIKHFFTWPEQDSNLHQPVSETGVSADLHHRAKNSLPKRANFGNVPGSRGAGKMFWEIRRPALRGSGGAPPRLAEEVTYSRFRYPNPVWLMDSVWWIGCRP